ncbi:carbohydrate binding domain-containing protein [Mycoplasmatota bacterium]|nr:carbohydrate binding domain-containing protein [Mycoplasmatota bacterium]
MEKVTSTVYASQSFRLNAGTHKVEAWIRNSGGAPGAYIDVISADIKGTINKVHSTDGWDKYELLFGLHSSKTITIKLINDSVSTVYFDNVHIVNEFVDTRYNVITNNSFESGLTGWTVEGAGLAYINLEKDILQEILGEKSIVINGDGNTRKTFTQDITNLVTIGETYMVGGWAKANSVPNKDIWDGPFESDNRFFGLTVKIEGRYLDDVVIKWLPFDSSNEDWQYQMRSFEVPQFTDNVSLIGVYQGEGTAYFDNLQLYHDNVGNHYTYTQSGNLEIIKNTSETTIEYDSSDHVKSVTTNGVKTNIERDSNTHLIKEITKNNVTTTFEYDDVTKQLKYTYVGYDKDKPINEQDKWFKTSIAYTTDNQYLNSVKDEFGNINYMDIDQQNGFLKTITDAIGNYQSFVYDEYGRLDSTSSNAVSGDGIDSNYKYNSDGKLWKIVRDGLEYEFIYNDLDQVEEVKIANTVVMSYDYLEKTDGEGDIYWNKYYTDLINSQTYGNGDIVSFEYNDENQVKVIKFNGVTRSEYDYDSSGRLSIYKDIYNNNIYFYSYNLAGQLENITDKDGNVIKYS